MDHESAVQSQAVERYLLQQMQPEERDAFEEHYVCCQSCWENLEITSLFMANARAVFKEQQVTPIKRPHTMWSWLRPQFAIPAFATLVLAVVVSYQNIVQIPMLEAPQSLSEPLILDPETRGATPAIHTGQPLRFELGLEKTPPSDWIEIQIISPSGDVKKAGRLKKPAANEPLDVYFPGALPPGHYAIVVRADENGKPGIELARSSFEIASKDRANNQ